MCVWCTSTHSGTTDSPLCVLPCWNYRTPLPSGGGTDTASSRGIYLTRIQSQPFGSLEPTALPLCRHGEEDTAARVSHGPACVARAAAHNISLGSSSRLVRHIGAHSMVLVAHRQTDRISHAGCSVHHPPHRLPQRGGGIAVPLLPATHGAGGREEALPPPCSALPRGRLSSLSPFWPPRTRSVAEGPAHPPAPHTRPPCGGRGRRPGSGAGAGPWGSVHRTLPPAAAGGGVAVGGGRPGGSQGQEGERARDGSRQTLRSR